MSRLHFTENRCGNCQSCNVRKVTGSCKKMGASLCSGCRDNQKCWRLSPCEYITDDAKEEFILSQLETRARLSKRGPVYPGTLLDRYGYRWKSLGRGLEKVPDPPTSQTAANPCSPCLSTHLSLCLCRPPVSLFPCTNHRCRRLPHFLGLHLRFYLPLRVMASIGSFASIFERLHLSFYLRLRFYLHLKCIASIGGSTSIFEPPIFGPPFLGF